MWALAKAGGNHHSQVGIISIFGPHFREKTAIAGTCFSASGDSGINLRVLSTSVPTLSRVIEEALRAGAVRAITEAFESPLFP